MILTTELSLQSPEVVLFNLGSTTTPKEGSPGGQGVGTGTQQWGYTYLPKPFLYRLRNPSEDAAKDLPAIRDLKKLEFA